MEPGTELSRFAEIASSCKMLGQVSPMVWVAASCPPHMDNSTEVQCTGRRTSPAATWPLAAAPASAMLARASRSASSSPFVVAAAVLELASTRHVCEQPAHPTPPCSMGYPRQQRATETCWACFPGSADFVLRKHLKSMGWVWSVSDIVIPSSLSSGVSTSGMPCLD